MNAQFKKGALELCVMSQLVKGDCYGYELTENVSKEMEIATGTLYLILKRMKDEEYVTSEAELAESFRTGEADDMDSDADLDFGDGQ